MTIQRFDPTEIWGGGVSMCTIDSGDYVLFDDYEDALLNAAWDLKELQKKYDNLVKAIGELYRDSA